MGKSFRYSLIVKIVECRWIVLELQNIQQQQLNEQKEQEKHELQFLL